jgi:two-component system, NtrC family, nitrogen regulation response regulator NtrX
MGRTMNAKILIVDDEEPIRRAFHSILELEPYDVYAAADGVECIELCKQMHFDVIFLDVNMPRMHGHQTLKELKMISPDTSVVMISGTGDIRTAVDAVNEGALDFIEKPLDLNRIQILIRNAVDRTTLSVENKAIKRKLKEVKPTREIIGESAGIRHIREKIEKAANHDQARVLILGPNGSGKELVARAIHEKSPRADKPFVEVNCAAIVDTLIDSTLFGHRKGSFTDAKADHKGYFEQASGGTIFLDEIGDMSLDAQAKILRTLQESKVLPIGTNTPIDIDVRVIAATNKDIRMAVKEGTFREDLYHRLCVIPIIVPPLNERRDDIPLLLEHYMSKISEQYGKPQLTFLPEALELLTALNWSGNIRQLRNVVERLVIFAKELNISASDVRDNVQEMEEKSTAHSLVSLCQELFIRFDSLAELQDYLAEEYKKFRGKN